jgi:hypothetical protein
MLKRKITEFFIRNNPQQNSEEDVISTDSVEIIEKDQFNLVIKKKRPNNYSEYNKDPGFRMEVVDYAKENGPSRASTYYNVSNSTVGEWVEKERAGKILLLLLLLLLLFSFSFCFFFFLFFLFFCLLIFLY